MPDPNVKNELRRHYERMRNDPAFATMPYSEQKKARAMITDRILKQDPEYQQLSPQERRKALEHFVYNSRPVFERPELNQSADPLLRQVEVGQLTNFQARMLGAFQGAINNGVFTNILAKPLAEVADAATDMADTILGTETPEQYRWPNLINVQTGKSGDKLMSYVNDQLWRQGKKKAASALKSGNMEGSILGFMGDFAVFHGSWAKLAATPMKRAGVEVAKRLGGRLGTWAGKVALPSVISGTSSGVFGVFREQFLATVNDDDERKQDIFEKVGRTFGEWALLDFAANLTLGTILPHVGGAWRRAFGKAKRVKEQTRFMPKQLDDMIDQTVNGNPPEDLINQLDPSMRRWFFGQADLRRAAGRLDDAVRTRPYDDLLMEGNAAGYTVYREPANGRYYLHGYDPAQKVVIEWEFEDIIGARRKVAQGLNSRLKDLEGEARREFIRLHKNMLQYEVTSQAIDGAFDPAKVKGYVGPKEAEAMKAGGKRAKDFVSPVDRPYVGANEAEQLKKVFGGKGYVQTMKVAVPEDALSNIAKGKRPFTSGMPLDVQAVDEGTDAFIMVRNPATPEAIEEASVMTRKAIANGAAESEDALRSMYLMESGFDGIVEQGGRVRMFYPDKVKLLATKFDPTTGKIGNPTTVKAEEPGLENFVTRQYEATIGAKPFAESRRVITQAASQLKGELDVNNLEQMSRMILASKGVDPAKVTVKASSFADAADEGADYMTQVHIKGGHVTIRVPRSITTPAKQKKFVKELFDEYKNVIESVGDASKAKKLVYPRLTKRVTNLYKSPFESVAESEKWLRESVEDIAKGSFSKTARGYQVKLPGKPEIIAESIDEVTDRLMMEMMDPAYLKLDMARRGYKLNVTKDQITVRGAGLDEPVTGKSVNEVADKLNYRPKKISNTFAPKVTIIDENAAKLTFENGTAIGSKRSIKKMLGKFEDMDEAARMQKVSGYETGEVYVKPSGDYEVHMPEIGVIEKFASKTEAERFLRRTWRDFDNLTEIARRKGLQVWQDGMTYKVSDGSETFVVRSRDDLIRTFNAYPDSSGGREVLEGMVDQDELNAIDKVLHNFNTANIPVQDGPPIRPLGDISVLDTQPLKSIGASGELRAIIDNMDHWAEVTLKKAGMQGVLEKYRQIEITYRMAKGEIDKAEQAVRAIFTDPKTGKLLPEARRKAIYYHSGAQTPDEELQALNIYGDLTPGEKTMAANLRKLLGEEKGGVLTGLAGTFNLPPEKFLRNYMPRIMDWAVQNQAAVAKMSSAEELIEAAARNVYGTGAPKHLKAFFKNMRTSEVLEFAAIDDPIKALQHYVRVGFRQKYMGKAWEELYGALAKSGVDEGVIHRFNRYRETLMGMGTPEGMKTARRIGEAWGKKVGMKNGANLIDAYFSMNYLANMGYRPWLALRNTYQVFTTLAPRIGNSWVDDAVGKVRKFTNADYEYLQRVGVIPNQPPIVNTIMDADSKLGWLTHKALGMFKSTDEYTRAVAFHSAAGRFDFAMSKWQRGTIKNVDDFLKEAGVTKMDDNTVKAVRRLVEEGSDQSVEAAKVRFGTQLSEESMFGYRQSQAPMLHTGSFWGKIFGQYGTYSAGYRSVIARGLTNGNFGDKAAFVARFLANQSALYAAFTALGINARNFIPGSPALFGGGPQFEVAVAIAQSMSPTYKGKQGRSILARKFLPLRHNEERGLYPNYPEMLPGSIQIRYAGKALEYLEQEDYWRAFLALTTTPIVDPDERP